MYYLRIIPVKFLRMKDLNSHFECMVRDELRKVQNDRLLETVERALFQCSYYRTKMQEAGLGPESIHSVDDLHRLPFTTKAGSRDNYPFGLFAVPMSEIVRIHASSGTTGKPTVVGYTRHDIATWSEVMARTLTSAGADRNDIIQVAYGTDYLQEVWEFITEVKNRSLSCPGIRR